MPDSDVATAAAAGRGPGEGGEKGLLRFLTCGSVDDGKSTLIGRLLYDARLLTDDQLGTLEAESRTGSRVESGKGSAIDFSLLVDGLQAEREQGITIDVAYRYFATPKRKFIVADTPGHEQYTRNMATGASTADLAVILVDARKGVITQTRRHSCIASLFGIRHVVVAVNKMDLVGWQQSVFEAIAGEYLGFAVGLGFETVHCLPLSALEGDNVFTRSSRMDWYRGPTLIEYLETLEVARDRAAGPLRMPVQWVNRPDQGFRGYAGTLAAGRVRPGDPVMVAPSGRASRVGRIVTGDGDLEEAVAGQSVTLTLEDELDISRGDILAAPDRPPTASDQIQARVLWMHAEHLLPGRPYILKLGSQSAAATVTDLKYRLDVQSLEHLAAKVLEMNEVGVCNLSLDRPIAFDPYAEVRETGGFILIDRFTNETVGAGMIDFALRRASNISWQALQVDKQTRAELKRQKPCVLWFTGLSGAGKSTVADLVEKRLNTLGHHTYLLDGDNVRHGLNRDLGFTDVDRIENIRRIAEVARLFVDAGLIVLVSFISPFRSERRVARDLMEQDEFLEVYVDTPLAICEERDPKGLYRKARAGQIKNFTGIDSPYEPPENAEIRIDTGLLEKEAAAEAVIALLEERGII
jgi:bifunctional enzyme CysN/CysC